MDCSRFTDGNCPAGHMLWIGNLKLAKHESVILKEMLI